MKKIKKIEKILKNPKYVSIIKFLKVMEDLKKEYPEQKHFRYFFLKKHGLDKDNTRKMEKYFYEGSEVENFKDIEKKIIHTIFAELMNIIGLSKFKSRQDINENLKRLKPYVLKTRSKKYYLSDFFYDEYLKYNINQIINESKMILENRKTYTKDGFFKVIFSKKDNIKLIVKLPLKELKIREKI